MAYDEKLTQRVADILKSNRSIHQQKMFGGVCFMYRGNMAVGVDKDRLMVRVGKDKYEYALNLKYARPMDFTGRPMKGFVFVSKEGYNTKASLKKWIDLGINFAKTLPAK